MEGTSRTYMYTKASMNIVSAYRLKDIQCYSFVSHVLLMSAVMGCEAVNHCVIHYKMLHQVR